MTRREPHGGGMDKNNHITRENAGTCTQKGAGTTGSGAQPAAPQSPICFIRTVGLVRGVAIGSSLTIGLNIFILLSLFLHRAGPQTPSLYLAALVLFLPIVLTCAERGAVIPGGGGPSGAPMPLAGCCSGGISP
jgi:hypothetical protein